MASIHDNHAFKEMSRAYDWRHPQEPEDFEDWDSDAPSWDEAPQHYDPECDCSVRGFTVFHKHGCPFYE